MSKDTGTAAGTIAAYLVGAPVERSALDAACAQLRDTPTAVAAMRRLFAPPTPADTDCAAFDANLPELVDMSPSERETSRSRLMAHARQCRVCRTRYRTLAFRWLPVHLVPRLRDALTASVRTLGTAIRVTIDAGRRGLALDAETELLYATEGAFAGALLGTPDAGSAPAARFDIADTEGGIAFHIRCLPEPAGTDILTEIVVTDAAGDRVDPARVTLNLRSASDLTLHTACTLDYFESGPLVLQPGAWLLEFALAGGAPGQRWCIPLNLQATAP